MIFTSPKKPRIIVWRRDPGADRKSGGSLENRLKPEEGKRRFVSFLANHFKEETEWHCHSVSFYPLLLALFAPSDVPKYACRSQIAHLHPGFRRRFIWRRDPGADRKSGVKQKDMQMREERRRPQKRDKRRESSKAGTNIKPVRQFSF